MTRKYMSQKDRKINDELGIIKYIYNIKNILYINDTIY